MNAPINSPRNAVPPRMPILIAESTVRKGTLHFRWVKGMTAHMDYNVKVVTFDISGIESACDLIAN